MKRLLFPFSYAAFIALGFLQPDSFDPGAHPISWAAACVPVVPLILAILLWLNASLPRRLTITSATVIAGTGVFLSILSASMSGAGESMALIHGLALTSSLCASLLFLSWQTQAFAKLLALPAALAACWSLAVPVFIAANTGELSGDKPYCLAHHGIGEDPVETWAELRGFSFYTTRSGYKSSSKWYFHGLLNVDARHYNWSPRHLSFHELENPRRMIAPVTGACAPMTGFLNRLSLI